MPSGYPRDLDYDVDVLRQLGGQATGREFGSAVGVGKCMGSRRLWWLAQAGLVDVRHSGYGPLRPSGNGKWAKKPNVYMLRTWANPVEGGLRQQARWL